MRHALGIMGVLAAGVLLAVSAAMNWRFGYQLGKTEFDGQIYGAASAAADCFKALTPFFLFAAIRNRMWSQAAAAACVWLVVTGYSLTAALGHAALNRQDTTGERAVQAQTYKDLRADLKRAQDQLSWVPQHRPAAAVESDISGMKGQRPWAWTKECSDIKGKEGREFCQKFHGLGAELASAQQGQRLEERISAINAKLAGVSGGKAMAEADPQASVLAQLTGISVEKVQIGLTVLVAILLEIGSGFGMFVAFSQWRLHDRQAPSAPAMPARVAPVAVRVKPVKAPAPAVEPVAKEEPRLDVKPEPVALPPAAPLVAAPPVSAAPVANDNKTMPRMVAPETDVQRFYKERLEPAEGSSLTATALYEDYCAWCEDQGKEPLALPTFGREFGELGVNKSKIAGRVRYIGIKLTSQSEGEEDKKQTASVDRAA